MQSVFRRSFVRNIWKGRSRGLSFYLREKGWLVGLIVTIALAAAVYWPGIHGPFLFDDFANLPELGKTGPVDNASTLARYLTSGTADPTGRPIAVASFLIDANDWPADPLPFKRTNILIHLLNGLLLFAVVRKLLRAAAGGNAQNAARVDLAALLAMAFWLLHPRLVSTTLYVVQREAMLPATFTLLGLLGWLAGRDLVASGRSRAGTACQVVSLGLCTVLATLSKANGVLLPVLVLTLEYTVLPALAHGARIHARTRVLTCWTVAVALLALLAQQGISNWLHGIDHRPWTESERLMTEPRILWTYLYELWIPRAYSAGLFNDAYPVSRSLVDPWTTLPAIAGIALLLGAAIHGRRTYPLFAAAVLFYFAGHLVESTTVALELYFEHRNYLPSMLLFLPAATWLAGFKMHADQPASKPLAFISKWPWRFAMTVATLALLAGMTYANARIWGDTKLQGRIWARLNPDSPRAQVTAAVDELQQGDAAAAIHRLKPMLTAHPREVQLSFNLIAARCETGDLTQSDLAAASYSLRESSDPGSLIVSWFERMTPIVAAGGCPGLTLADLVRLANDGAENPRYPDGRRQDLAHARGVLEMASGQPDAALASFNRALDYNPQLETALAQAAFLGSSGYPALGLAHLAHYDTLPPQADTQTSSPGMPAVHAWVLSRQQYWTRERARLEKTLAQAEKESR